MRTEHSRPADDGRLHSEALACRHGDGGPPPFAPRLGDLVAALLAFAVPFALYLRTMAPTVCSHDSAELAAGAYTLGIVHPPGAPTYLLLARLFCFLPVGDIAWRVNLLSGAGASAAVLFVYLCARELGCGAAVSLIAAWMLAFSYHFWAWATVAELYATHACFAAAVLWLVLRWGSSRQQRCLWFAGAVFGLGFGNHTSLILLVPAIGWLVLTDASRPWRRPAGLVGPVAAAGLAALTVFLYLPLRHAAAPAVDWITDTGAAVDPASPAGFLWMVRGGPFARLFFAVPPREVGARVCAFARQLFADFGVAGVLAGIAGLAAGCAGTGRPRRTMTALALVFVCHTAFFVTYNIYDWEWMFTTSHVAWALMAAVGLAAVSRRGAGPLRLGPLLVSAFGLALVAGLVWSNYGAVDRSGDYLARETAGEMLYGLPPGAVAHTGWRMFHVARYLQVVEGVRTDVTMARDDRARTGDGRNRQHTRR